MRVAAGLFVAWALVQVAAAQGGPQTVPSREEMEKQRAATAESNRVEHERELHLLGLTATRPRVNGSGKGPNPVNYDESKAVVTDATVMQPGVLPPVLQFTNGRSVRTAQDWTRRRVELLKLFDEVELGVTPAGVPPVFWQVVSETQETQFEQPVRVKVLKGLLDNSAARQIDVQIAFTVVTPASAAGKRVPVVMEFHWDLPKEFLARLPREPGKPWQQQVLERGWGYAEYQPYSVQPDNGAGLTMGVIGLTNKGKPRPVQDWGALKAWAWGAPRSLDYLQTDADVDAKWVAIEGHSRFGKAALVAMAYDPRFAAVFVSSSGAGGANLWRRNFGEQLENVESDEYWWEGANLLKYATDPLHAEDLPLDQHELIALCAPRLVFISAGSKGDEWVDAHGMFLSAVAASPVWELLGKHGLRDASGPVTAFPPIETPIVTGEVAYRQHTAGHTPGPNWPMFLDFAGRYLGTPSVAKK